MRRVIRIMLWIALILVTGLAVMVRLRYGGGQSYRDVTGAPILSGDELETVLSYPEPIGNVAVSSDGRGFFTVHPESRPEGAKLLEFRDGAAWPYPSEEFQDEIFQTPLGVVVDRQHRLWIIDHGKHGFGTPRLLAIDLLTDEVVHDHRFDNTAAPGGSFLQDLQVSPDGCTVFIADVSFWRKRPAIVVQVLEGHPSVAAQDWIITTSSKRMVFFGGLAAMKPGIDGIAVTPDGAWLTYGAMSHDTLYRVPTTALLDTSLGDRSVASRVEALGHKPLSDGLSADLEGGIWITDVRIRWADALSFGPDGWLYLADSAIPDQVMRSKSHIASQAPYFIFRFRPGVEGVPGH
jgi:sugar lactone lactonase YvrE